MHTHVFFHSLSLCVACALPKMTNELSHCLIQKFKSKWVFNVFAIDLFHFNHQFNASEIRLWALRNIPLQTTTATTTIAISSLQTPCLCLTMMRAFVNSVYLKMNFLSNCPALSRSHCKCIRLCVRTIHIKLLFRSSSPQPSLIILYLRTHAFFSPTHRV